MQTDSNAKQQIVERIKNSTNILVTVGSNPSVDELSSALALTLMLNHMDKHVTAVFSGAIPPAIEFLQPEKTFEPTVDSLRDFIIALDKEKADRLRYKVEDDVVRIFITPYKTVISQKDLQFSQGDFNVELIIALGVEKREELDAAITAHGRILHDATVVTINSDAAKKSDLGSIDWSDAGSSSLCEMLMSLSESLKSGILDEQIATALLTGIVSATDRFRNEHTSPRVMTMSAQLMAAGANQQLIAAKLEESHSEPVSVDSSHKLSDETSEKLDTDTVVAAKTESDGSLDISHDVDSVATDAVLDISAEEVLDADLGAIGASASPALSVKDIQDDLVRSSDNAGDEDLGSFETPIIKKEHRNWRSGSTSDAPTFGGTLNATVADAEDEKRKEEQVWASQQLLSHDSPAADNPMDVANTTVVPVEAAIVQDDPVAATNLVPAASDGDLSYEVAPVPVPTLAEIDEQVRDTATDDARAAVDAALSAMPFDPSGQPSQSVGALPGLELQHDEPLLSPAYTDPVAVDEPEESMPSEASEAVTSIPSVESPTPEAPALPPLPDFSTLPPLPGELPAEPVIQPATVSTNSGLPTAPADPAQFRIPGQP